MEEPLTFLPDMSQRPKDEKELQKLEAIGVIHASRFVRKYSRTNKPITVKTVCDIHREIFINVWPEIAGKFRDEEIEITDSKHYPPHPIDVPKLMEKTDWELVAILDNLTSLDGVFLSDDNITEETAVNIDDVIMAVAWLHHAITHIHPFREGNGRTARLVANLVLERYGLIGISIKIEKENKDRYRKALSQIDKNKDYEPLKKIIYEGLLDRYNGISMKYCNIR